MPNRQSVYEAIDTEREYQETIWPNPDQSIGEELLLMEEYISKARTLWSQETYPEVGAVDIVRKIAGIAVRCMEQHDAPHRKNAA